MQFVSQTRSRPLLCGIAAASLCAGLLFAWGIIIFGLANLAFEYLAITSALISIAAVIGGRFWSAAAISGIIAFFSPALLVGIFIEVKIMGFGLPIVATLLCGLMLSVVKIGSHLRKAAKKQPNGPSSIVPNPDFRR
jgi:hypothetical protein